MTIATNKEAPVRHDQGFGTTATNQEEAVMETVQHGTHIRAAQFAGRHMALRGRMPSDAVDLVDEINREHFHPEEP